MSFHRNATHASLIAAATLLLGACLGESDSTGQDEDDVATAQTAEELASDCQHGANGFVDVSNSVTGNVVYHADSTSPSDVTVSLRYATLSGAQRGFARLGGDTRRGDNVWMRFQHVNSQGHVVEIKCGPFEVTTPRQTLTTPAMKTSSASSWRFMACANGAQRDQVCTPWW